MRINEDLFKAICKAAGEKALEMLQDGKKLRGRKSDFCRAVIELMATLMKNDMSNVENT